MEDGPCRDHATPEGFYGGLTPLSMRLKQKCSTEMADRGVWEEIPMNVPSTPVVEG